MTSKYKGFFPFHRGIMWPSLLKIQYTELKFSCGNGPVKVTISINIIFDSRAVSAREL
jgi:hypothetical protein